MKRTLWNALCAAIAVLAVSSMPAAASEASHLEPVGIKAPTSELSDPAVYPDLNAPGIVMEELTSGRSMYGQNGSTRQFTDFITTADELKYIQFSLSEGQIFNATLAGPSNPNLDYNLVLCSVGSDGSFTAIKSCTLGTYIDPDTGKTVEEGISYLHNQGMAGDFAIVVMSAKGSSTQDSFTLTISTDDADSYDINETNDSPFEATPLSLSTSLPLTAKANGSLHMANDQDWFAVTTNGGVFNVTAGDYKAEVYFVATGNRMVLATKNHKGDYVLGDGTYFIKVFSDAALDDFTFDAYTLQMADQSKYTTLATAYNFGDWETSSGKWPDNLPQGQASAIYKISIDPEDRAYASILLTGVGADEPVLIETLNEQEGTIDYGFTGNEQLAAKGYITTKKGSKKVVVDVNGADASNKTGYIKVTRLQPMKSVTLSPAISKRIDSGYATFKISGTATNPGHDFSSILTIDLSNKSNIPPHAMVKDITTKSRISPSVAGVETMLNPGGKGWIAMTSGYSSAGSVNATFRIGAEAGIEVKQLWQFRSYQGAFARTKMTGSEMQVSWEYDMRYTGYEMFQ